jgi:hypothetical protein
MKPEDITIITDTGLCCACNKEPATGILMLERQAPIPGTGWGCVVCGIPMNGAIAVLCDSCGVGNTKVMFACFGNLTDKKRIDIRQLKGSHRHDLSKHPEVIDREIHRCIGCGCTEKHACAGGCAWVGLNDETGLGVCTNCPGSLKDFSFRWYKGSPDVGDPECICSLCQKPITEDDGPAIRIFDQDNEARFHRICGSLLIYAGVIKPEAHS